MLVCYIMNNFLYNANFKLTHVRNCDVMKMVAILNVVKCLKGDVGYNKDVIQPIFIKLVKLSDMLHKMHIE